ncbi:MAG: hypothetical protein SPF56_06375 [Bacteroidaceae bacterium]|nr:hypothetical protein [Prevotellaceae bacterium]MDY5632099.1 hypothetical protein [Bacteroidaceae bacterium]
MTSKHNALFALMQEQGYSHGLCTTALHILGQTPAAMDVLINFIYAKRPSEKEVIQHIATLFERGETDADLHETEGS